MKAKIHDQDMVQIRWAEITKCVGANLLVGSPPTVVMGGYIRDLLACAATLILSTLFLRENTLTFGLTMTKTQGQHLSFI